MDEVLPKMQALIQYLNYGEDGKYRFYDQEAKNRKLGKLFTKIADITTKIMKVLEDLLSQLAEKNASIAKVWVILSACMLLNKIISLIGQEIINQSADSCSSSSRAWSTSYLANLYRSKLS